MAKYHIKQVVMNVSGSRVEIMSGDLTTSVETVEVTDTGSGGFQEFLDGGGIERGAFSFKGVWRDDAMPHTNPPNLRAGKVLPFTLQLAPGKVYVGTILIENVKYALGTTTGTDAITYEVSAQTSSPTAYPA